MRCTRRHFLGICGAGLLAGPAVYATAIEPTWLRTVRLDLPVAGLPAALDGFTIAQLSDLHVGGGVPLAHLENAVAVANAARPDLAVVTGDLVDGGGPAAAATEAAALLAELAPRHGTFAVFGNHDTGAYTPGRRVDAAAMGHLRRALEGAGIDLLCNEARRLDAGGASLRVAGGGDLWSGHFEPDRLALEPDALNLVLSHNPDTALELESRGADVILSGHTHGGQVCFPLLGPPYVPVRHKEFLSGHFRLGESHLYVNPGLGYTTFGIRFGARPEITLLTLRQLRTFAA